MKTCTVTFFYAKNYGTFLQAWALQKFMGEFNSLIYLNPSDNYHFYVNNRFKKIPFFRHFFALLYYLFRRRKCFSEVSVMLRHTRKYFSEKELMENPPKSDIYIAGSDQIWNENMFWGAHYFLGFGSPNAKRIAYAASMGSKEWSNSFTQKVLPYLRKFNAISVREESSVQFLNSIGLENVAVTCDPTILHTADFYRSHFPCRENKCCNHIFIYRFQKKYSNSMQQFLSEKDIVELELNKHNKYVSVVQWLNNIDSSSAVITDSFHGTVFSILFHKPFIVFPQMAKDLQSRNERFVSLLKKVKLEYRLLNGSETKEEIEEILYRPIDWEQVDKILEELRTYSADWLRNALEK